MSSPKNLQRDGSWLELDDTIDSTWGSSFVSTTSGQLTVSAGDVTVYDDRARCKPDNGATIAIAAGNWKGIGCYMSPPGLDTVPYRVKARLMNLAYFTNMFIGVGYAPETITGTDDVITQFCALPFDRTIDELIMVPALADTDPLYGRAICFSLILGETATAGTYGYLSVQKLSTSPPMFAQSVS